VNRVHLDNPNIKKRKDKKKGLKSPSSSIFTSKREMGIRNKTKGKKNSNEGRIKSKGISKEEYGTKKTTRICSMTMTMPMSPSINIINLLIPISTRSID
jgi:hypothetical protein